MLGYKPPRATETTAQINEFSFTPNSRPHDRWWRYMYYKYNALYMSCITTLCGFSNALYMSCITTLCGFSNALYMSCITTLCGFSNALYMMSCITTLCGFSNALYMMSCITTLCGFSNALYMMSCITTLCGFSNALLLQFLPTTCIPGKWLVTPWRHEGETAWQTYSSSKVIIFRPESTGMPLVIIIFRKSGLLNSLS